ncbi:prolipoprotein diacylglyceryl transferase [Drancourtella massiliensis]|uniref:Phosphatidylglycerol--prolipoprotein diacylglyceryl transferase n=1 Tax=Drancourtella massiliensis TaxID=1632013 RepID=A0ABS2EKP4_9FIRM|nr:MULTISPECIES: prolipoprotein diacylglyceryl transferase [Oscillospiraceae]MBM6745541.1 prolipoprotein diacylglyceryl transferase [Drancourtella massiliensis]OUN70630.1 prolipoprotein diacylglyceryl transferase [Drancourtella sp. An57]OUQ45700.1 prolipoprotein diacylglyceryl transferase [Drancourtella sp. An12]HIV94142.1 prolipoprotein diacylglyceryl transferase [Candidatus Sellimonas avistercoris]
MKNDLLTIGGLTVHGYGLMIGIGFIAAYLMTEFRARKYRMNTDIVFTLFISSVVFGLLGAKVLYYLTILDRVIKDPGVILDEMEGFVVYGGIIGGVLAGYVVCRIKKEKFWQYFDLIAPAIALAQGFGRIGCLLAGCCYGKETDSPLSITFHTSDFAPNDVALIPTQIYSSILDFLNCIVLCLIARYAKKERTVSGCYLIFYSTGRFILEFFRGDLERGSVGVLSTSQFISIFIFVIGAAILFTGKKKALVMK